MSIKLESFPKELLFFNFMHGTIATSQRLQRTVSVYVHSLEKGSILFVKMEGEMEEKLLRQAEENLLRQAEENHVDEEINLKDKVWTETKKMWIVAGPAIFTRFSTFGMNLVSQAFVGHIGSTELAAYSLVVTVLLRFANGILLGMASALETLCGQAYGAQQHHMMGIYLQRSWIVLFICSIFLLPVFIFTTPILIALGQEREIAELAGVISYWLLPVMFAFIISFTCQMFLQAQSKNMIISYLAAFSFSIHLLLSWLLTVKYKFGIMGAMVSTVMAYWIPNMGQLMFVMYGGCSETWKGFSIFAFKDLWPVMKLSLSSGAMLCLELWYNTVLILLTGNMKNAEVSIDALSICLNVNGLEMMISLGFLAAASVRVSNELGRGSSKAAKFSIIVTVCTSFAIGLVLFLFFLLLKGRLAYIFTDNYEVARAVADLSLLLAFSILLNSVQPVLSGVAVGAGWQSIVAYVNLSCYYLIGIPVGVVLGYVSKFGVKGVWMGMLLGTFVQTVVLIIITWRTDWDKQVIIARKRVSKWVVAESAEESTPKRQEV
ncbi:protein DETOXIFICATION 21-like isoform X2 [Pistacia vera]|uniref:protein DETOXIFICATION 21-like isoform X2 n=1 Tax=Pistacia vera TaxID=55513 RepID=UPI0012638700|nr:protein DETOXIFICATION 21-like isoform X2 [Pistacia vera]XP_031286645.1 protein DETOXIFICATION 21-like isoform X2 [Pistacia vera]